MKNYFEDIQIGDKFINGIGNLTTVINKDSNIIELQSSTGKIWKREDCNFNDYFNNGVYRNIQKLKTSTRNWQECAIKETLNLSNTKIRIKDEDQFDLVKTVSSELGWKWSNNDEFSIEFPFIYFNGKGTINYGQVEKFFKENTKTELNITDFLNYKTNQDEKQKNSKVDSKRIVEPKSRTIRASFSRKELRGCRSSFEKSYRRQGKRIERVSPSRRR